MILDYRVVTMKEKVVNAKHHVITSEESDPDIQHNFKSLSPLPLRVGTLEEPPFPKTHQSPLEATPI